MFRNQFTEDRFVAAVEKFVDAYTTTVRVASTPAPSAPTVTFEDVKNFLRQGRKIDAIKAFRQLTNASLYDAKHQVDLIKL